MRSSESPLRRDKFRHDCLTNQFQRNLTTGNYEVVKFHLIESRAERFLGFIMQRPHKGIAVEVTNSLARIPCGVTLYLFRCKGVA